MPLKNQDEDLFEFVGFTGLRNTVGPAGFEPSDLEVGLNIDIDDALFVHRRKGYSAAVVSGACHSLWAKGATCLVVRNNDLVQVNPDMSSVTVHTGLAVNRPVSYAAVADRIYYSNGVEFGVVQGGQHRTWGVVPPVLGPAVVVGGALQPGRYQYSMTYLRQDGQESGAPRAQMIELIAVGGFELTLSVSSDPTVDRKAIYVSDRDGEALHRFVELDNAVTTFAVRELYGRLGAPLETQFLSPPPAGEHIAYGNGRLLVAQGSRLYPSAPYAPELFDLRKGVPFLSAITMVAPLENGTWLGTQDQVIWLPNAEPEKWDFRVRAEYGVVPGTATYGDGELIGDGSQKTQAVYFFSKQGPCVGLPGGQLVNFTQDRFAPPQQARGAGIVRRHRGIAQYVATLKGAEIAGSTAA